MTEGSFSNQRIVKNTVFLYLRMTFVMLVTIYTVRVVLNALGEVDYGVYNVVCGFVSLFGMLNTTLASGTSRFYNYEIGKNGKEGVKQVYNTSFIIQVVAAIIIFLLVEIIGGWYMAHKMVIPDDRMTTAKLIFQFSAISLVFVMIETPYSAAVIAHEKMNFFAIVGVLDAVLKLTIAILIFNAKTDKLLIYGALMLLVSLMNFCMYFFYCKVKFKEIRLLKKINKNLFKPMLTFSGWLMLDPIAYTLKGQGCNLALNFFYGPIMNTAYGIANQVSVALDSFSGNISTAIKPQMIQSYSSGNYNRTKSLFFTMSKMLFVLKLMLCVPIVLEADTLLHLWLGDAFPAITVSFVKLLVVTSVINSFGYPITVVISATGEMKQYMITTSIIVGAVLPISIVLLSLGFEPVCVFWVMIMSAVANLIVCAWILSKEFNVISITDYILRIMLPCIIHTVLSTMLPLIVFLLMPSSLIRFFVVCVAAGVSSLCSLYFVVFDKREKLLFTGMLQKMFQRTSFEENK